MKILFWASLLIILYVYLGYPLLAYLFSLLYKKPLAAKYVYPTVSILISVHNEEANIQNKINSLMELDYPKDRLEVIFGSDGSTDGTERIIEKYVGGQGFKDSRGQGLGELRNQGFGYVLIKQAERAGKPSMLNKLVREAKGEILVFTDARQRLDRSALKELVKHFADGKVGSVSSELIYDNEGPESRSVGGINLYWKYEKFIRKSESRMGSMLGATGALYAIRRELFPGLPKDMILDDVYIPMKIVEKGFRAVFDPKARIYDKVFSDPKIEFSRRVRTLAGNFQLFYYLRELFNPFRGKISWQFFSHKFLRLVMPVFLLLLLLSSAFLSSEAFYKTFFLLQEAFYILAIMGKYSKRRNKIFDVPYMFCVMNYAAVIGFYRFLNNKQGVLWEKAAVLDLHKA